VQDNGRLKMSDLNHKNDMTEFVKLLTAHHGQLYSYTLSLVGNFADADDVFQETTSKMWELFSGFEPGTDFLSWSITIAYYRVLDYRKRKQRDSKLLFGDDFFQNISQNALSELSKTNEYLEKLKECVTKLPEQDAKILKMRYMSELKVHEISTRISKSVRNVYFILYRIQRLLLRCMETAR
jgi:RNA polymerase sigma-70 factor, ECF subfamily